MEGIKEPRENGVADVGREIRYEGDKRRRNRVLLSEN